MPSILSSHSSSSKNLLQIIAVMIERSSKYIHIIRKENTHIAKCRSPRTLCMRHWKLEGTVKPNGTRLKWEKPISRAENAVYTLSPSANSCWSSPLHKSKDENQLDTRRMSRTSSNSGQGIGFFDGPGVQCSKCFTYYYPWQTCYIHHLLNSLRNIHPLTRFKAPHSMQVQLPSLSLTRYHLWLTEPKHHCNHP